MHTIVNTKNASAAIGPYNQAIRVGNLIFTSGQLGVNPNSGKLVDGLEPQIRTTLNNLREVLLASGAQMRDVVKFNIYLKDMNDFDRVNTIMKEYIPSPHPARTCHQPVAMPKGALFLMDAIAVLEQ